MFQDRHDNLERLTSSTTGVAGCRPLALPPTPPACEKDWEWELAGPPRQSRLVKS